MSRNSAIILMHLNIRSLPHYFDKLKILLLSIKIKPHVISLNETWIKHGHMDEFNCLSDYVIISNSREKSPGVVVVFFYCRAKTNTQIARTNKQTQGPRPRPRTQKNFEAKAKDQRHRRKCFLQKKVFWKFFQAKKVFKNFFQAISTWGNQKNGLCRFSARFLAFSNEISTVQK